MNRCDVCGAQVPTLVGLCASCNHDWLGSDERETVVQVEAHMRAGFVTRKRAIKAEAAKMLDDAARAGIAARLGRP